MEMNVHKILGRYFKGIEPIATLVSKRLEEGGVCVTREELMSEAGVTQEWFDKAIQQSEYITTDKKELKPFVYHKDKIYMHRYFTYETGILQFLWRASRSNGVEAAVCSDKEIVKICSWLNAEQIGAVQHALAHAFTIITGGPGTGKTTTIAIILALLKMQKPDQSIALAAPTGKAAARMNEALINAIDNLDAISDEVRDSLRLLEAKTLHRLLGSRPNEIGFKYNSDNPLPYDVLVVDESSMIDVALMSKLLSAMSPNGRLILLGDKDQLASVEAGSVFGDLCVGSEKEGLEDLIAVLRRSHRFDPDKGIGLVSRSIIGGDISFLDRPKQWSEQVTVKCDAESEDELYKELALHYRAYVEEKDVNEALKKLNNIRFLCAVRDGEQGMYATNRQIEQILEAYYRDNDAVSFSPKGLYYHNQPIIITQNDYTLGVYNGDVGLIRSDGDKGLFAYFEGGEAGNLKRYPVALLGHFETVFAMTIHKSQGSEFEKVVVILPKSGGERMLTRELLYTAVTRAKKEVYIYADKAVIEQCVSSRVQRSSGIIDRIKEDEA